MGTRSGDVDPGLLGYMAERLDLDVSGVLDVLNTSSGLLGLSCISNDMRTLTDAADKGSESAALAIEVFSYRVAKAVGALTVALGRLDVLVFTGGIGEAAAGVRSTILGRLGVLGIHEDPDANLDHGRSSDGRIGLVGDPVVTLVVPTDEERLIASDAHRLVSRTTRGRTPPR